MDLKCTIQIICPIQHVTPVYRPDAVCMVQQWIEYQLHRICRTDHHEKYRPDIMFEMTGAIIICKPDNRGQQPVDGYEKHGIRNVRHDLPSGGQLRDARQYRYTCPAHDPLNIVCYFFLIVQRPDQKCDQCNRNQSVCNLIPQLHSHR